MSELQHMIEQASLASFGLVPLPAPSRAVKRAHAAMRRRVRRHLVELEELKRAVRRCREELLDFNPTISLMADALEKAIEMEITARGCAAFQPRSEPAV